MSDSLTAFLICLSNGSISLSLTMINKMLFTAYSFRFTFTILLAQFIVNVLVCEMVKIIIPKGHKPGTLIHSVEMPSFSWTALKYQYNLTIYFLCNVCCGVAGLSLVNVPMFIALRRFNTCQIYLYDIFFLKKKSSIGVTISIIMIAIGTTIAALNDLTADIFGYVFVILNNTFTTLQFQKSAQIAKQSNMGSNAMTQTYYNSLTGIPILLVLTILAESTRLANYDKYADPNFWLVFLGSCSLGIFLSITINMNNILNSPLTTAMTGEVKNIVGTLLGFLFGDVIITKNLIIGLSLSMAGSLIYSASKYRAMQNQAQANKNKKQEDEVQKSSESNKAVKKD